MKQKIFYLDDPVLHLLEALATVTGKSQSEIARNALREYLEDMRNALSEDTEKAELIEQLLQMSKTRAQTP